MFKKILLITHFTWMSCLPYARVILESHYYIKYLSLSVRLSISNGTAYDPLYTACSEQTSSDCV